MNNLFMLFVCGLFLGGPEQSRIYSTAHRRPEPYVMSERESEDCLAADVCERMVYFVKNPMPYPVKVVFSCGPELTDVEVRVRAKDIIGVEITQEMPGKPRCFMMSWQRAK